jgi:hypothetical protein
MENCKTTREEDMAYALLDLFDIQMPLIYGEGRKKASNRLLKELDEVTKPLPIPIVNEAAYDSRAEDHKAQCYS